MVADRSGVVAPVTADETLIEVRLNAIRYAARDANLYELVRADGAPLPAAEPGAHVDLHLPNGIVRQYSLTIPDPSPTRYVLGIKRDAASRGGSKYVFEELRVGQRITISAPRNNFGLTEDAAHVVLLAGGIGITPIFAMVQRLGALGRSWELHYSCRSRAHMAFFDALRHFKQARLHFDDEAGGKFLDLAGIIGSMRESTHLYCCGPTPMLAAFEAATKSWPAERLHLEYFTAKEAAGLEGGFVVRLARFDKEFLIPPGKSILEVLRAAGFNLPYSCQEGLCGSCETKVIAGIPDHRDSVLTQSERAANDTMMICCGGSKTEKLVLDI
jgi:tetrachlorobenzoquinone reductase